MIYINEEPVIKFEDNEIEITEDEISNEIVL